MCIFSVLILLFSIQNYARAETQSNLYIEDAIKYANKNTVTINICMKNVNKKICTLGLDVKYDKTKLKFVSTKVGKNLNASMQIAENIEEESRVAIGLMNLNGFKEDGIYYTVTFNVLEEKENIPIQLSLREASDSKGQSIEMNVENGIIKISDENIDEEIKKSPEHQKIESFEEIELNELEKITDLIKDKGKIEVAETDDLIYEIQDSNIVKVLTDGTIIPVKDGTTNVRVKLNEEVIGNVEIEVKNDKPFKIKATNENINFEETLSTNAGIISDKNESSKIETKIEKNQENKEKQKPNLKIILVIIIIVIAVFLIMILIFKIKNKFRKVIGGKK